VPKSKADAVGSAFARLLRTKRAELDLSIYIIAKRARISHTTLLRIENETRKPSLDILLRIADAMGIELWKLLKEAEESGEGRQRA
jgi:transcriptional regulator with XRE-family HTH domain